MSAVVIVVDTNMLQTSPGLSPPEWASLIEDAADWGLRFAIPAVVELETIDNVRRSWTEKRKKVHDLKIAGLGVDESKQAPATAHRPCRPSARRPLLPRCASREA